jgi:uncharacterized membrane protein
MQALREARKTMFAANATILLLMWLPFVLNEPRIMTNPA